MREAVIINDVGPRDGLQNQARILAPAQRLELIRALIAAGVNNIEVGSFVSPKTVPAMAGAAEVMAALTPTPDSCYSALIPNLKGYELACAAGVRKIVMVVYGSEGMACKNANMGKQQAERVTEEILRRARTDGIKISAAIAVAFECPFDGPVDPSEVERIAAHFLQLGADEVGIADTIGAANPGQVRALTTSLVTRHGSERLSCHFHDTRAMGLANVFAALESGIRKFDASIAGLGGCPFAPGASGNVATEDVVMMLEQMGYDTGINLVALLEAAQLAQTLTGTAPGGRSTPWLKRKIWGQSKNPKL
jgi:hydroxymethylglutaryl-CoA lyase